MTQELLLAKYLAEVSAQLLDVARRLAAGRGIETEAEKSFGFKSKAVATYDAAVEADTIAAQLRGGLKATIARGPAAGA